jgi:hypothetical protein
VGQENAELQHKLFDHSANYQPLIGPIDDPKDPADDVTDR